MILSAKKVKRHCSPKYALDLDLLRVFHPKFSVYALLASEQRFLIRMNLEYAQTNVKVKFMFFVCLFVCFGSSVVVFMSIPAHQQCRREERAGLSRDFSAATHVHAFKIYMYHPSLLGVLPADCDECVSAKRIRLPVVVCRSM
jgi:hypothetical protein